MAQGHWLSLSSHYFIVYYAFLVWEGEAQWVQWLMDYMGGHCTSNSLPGSQMPMCTLPHPSPSSSTQIPWFWFSCQDVQASGTIQSQDQKPLAPCLFSTPLFSFSPIPREAQYTLCSPFSLLFSILSCATSLGDRLSPHAHPLNDNSMLVLASSTRRVQWLQG